ncbi:uncharacterized protein VTP21DRAFT_7455 [Calcarisporiella thermophila]|uniref:uncharacterized protein n=1 Tax=Calcarisporiella thermophila TaxID=911321 RepID=UPI003743FAFA
MWLVADVQFSDAIFARNDLFLNCTTLLTAGTGSRYLYPNLCILLAGLLILFALPRLQFFNSEWMYSWVGCVSQELDYFVDPKPTVYI